jgi:hypothetical protein
MKRQEAPTGFTLIDPTDGDAAMAVAQSIRTMRQGGVAVRPVMVFG